jgi:uncharacterized protein YjiS (DUF1127 family)
MSAITVTTFRPWWEQLKLRVGEWHGQLRSRHELEGLSDATLRDIGVIRCRVHRPMNSLFWMA